MTLPFILIALLIIIGIAVILFFLRRWLAELLQSQKPSQELMAWLQSTNQRMDLQGKHINDRLDNAAQVIAAVQKNIGEMSGIGRDMKSLSDMLRNPKLRGNIGEHILKELLGQMLPKQSFFLQYTFKSGAIVDAAIKTTNGIIPIDAKFSLENFRAMMAAQSDEEKHAAEKNFERDVRKHIDDISGKYILAEEGTIDYALMYVPSEAVYYEIINNPKLFDYAGSRRILPVSPMTFYAYLRTILMSFEGQKIEKEAKKILQTLRSLQKDYVKVEENVLTLNRHLTHAYQQMSQVMGGFSLLGQKLSATSQLESTDVNDEERLELSSK